MTTTVTDSQDVQIAKTVNVYDDGRLKSATSYDAQDQILTQVTYGYNAFSQLHTVTTATGITTYEYYNDGRLKSETTPPAVDNPTSAGDLPQVTSYVYTEAPDGTLTKAITLPDQKTQAEIYNPDGSLHSRTGARTYPVEYAYDYAGRMATMKTWQDYPSGTPVLTQWEYNDQGLLEKKYYDYDEGNPGSPDLSYTYDDAGRLTTRTGGRGIVTTYAVDPNYGYQTGITYSDGVTPAVTYSQFDRAGRPGQVSDASGARTLAYDKGQLDVETYTSGPLADITIDREFDDAARYEGYSLLDDATPLNAVDLDFDPVTGRLEDISFIHGGRTHTATYGYEAGTNRVDSVTQDNGAATILAVAKTHDNLHRLRSLHYDPSHQELGMAFTYNMANQLTRSTLLDGSGANWVYDYDELGQVIDARKQLPAIGAIPGYEFGYGYDDIGNRTFANRDGSTDREQRYYSEVNEEGINGANALNQYGSRSVPRMLGVIGSADSSATVTVNSQATQRANDNFQALLDYSGSDSAQDVTLDIEAILAGAGQGGSDAIAELTEQAYLPPTPEDFTYDDDGNLKTDWRWIYTWNGENRLVALEPTDAAKAVGLPDEKIAYAYDSQGRRFLREVYDRDTQTGVWEDSPREFTIFVYDGWILIGERTFEAAGITLTDEDYYVWGLDMSESLPGAGGVGGLLAVIDGGGDVSYPYYDHNGNVRGYVDGVSAQTVAEYEYGPFGRTIRAEGTKANDLTLRFSTKQIDQTSNLYYYGYRWYHPTMGRWPSRDPIGERGGLNLYAFVNNRPVDAFDYMGLFLKHVKYENGALYVDYKGWGGSIGKEGGNVSYYARSKWTPPVIGTFLGAIDLSAKFDASFKPNDLPESECGYNLGDWEFEESGYNTGVRNWINPYARAHATLKRGEVATVNATAEVIWYGLWINFNSQGSFSLRARYWSDEFCKCFDIRGSGQYDAQADVNPAGIAATAYVGVEASAWVGRQILLRGRVFILFVKGGGAGASVVAPIFAFD